MKKSAKKLPVTKAAVTKTTKAPAKKIAAPAKKKSTAASAGPSVTYISAQIDIGFGNHLTIRGEGPDLSWDKGLAMDCVGPNVWTATLTKVSRPVTFKLLVNDLTWSTGADYVVAPGKSITIFPTF